MTEPRPPLASSVSEWIAAHGLRLVWQRWSAIDIAVVIGAPPEAIAGPADAVLSAAERARAVRFYRPADQLAYLWRTWLLRQSLGDRLQRPPQHVRLTTNRWGKPRLADAEARYAFNLSFTSNAVAIAVSEGGPIGVDVERGRRLEDLDAVARQVMDPSERDRWQRLRPEQRTTWFYSLWTLKEAVIKCAGYGMSLPPDRFAVDPAAAELTTQRIACTGPDGCCWHIGAAILQRHGGLFLAAARSESPRG